MSSDNPLLTPSKLPNFAPPFDRVRVEHYLPAVRAAIDSARGNMHAIRENPDPPTFANTIVALETAAEQLDSITKTFHNQISAVGGDELQALVGEIGPLSANFGSEVLLDERLFARVRAVYEQSATLHLPPEQHQLLENTYREFVRGGALLEPKSKERIREINERLSLLGPAFMEHVQKSGEAFEMLISNPEDLVGLPTTSRNIAGSMAKERGYADGWLFTLDLPSYLPFMQHADRRDLREKLWRAFTARAWGGEYDNRATLLETVNLRNERANLLGYPSHAHYVLELRMAERPEQVFAFLDTLKSAYLKAAEIELDDLRRFAADRDGITDFTHWDIPYYMEKLRQQRFQFSSEDLRPYFPLEKVLSGTFEHFSRLFQLRFEANDRYSVWHPDVKAFDVTDAGTGSFIGTLYADFHPRKGKKSGAWMTTYRNQGLFRGTVERPVAAIVCNFTKPTGDTPALLRHDEVTTLFHEMGHAVHGLLSNVTYRSLAGTSVLWDFVELPSQVQENWCYEQETLDLISGHYRSGESIPTDLVEKLRASSNFMVGWTGLRQTAFATLDMAWHTVDPHTVTDVAAFEDQTLRGLSPFPRLGGPISVTLGHIFTWGYSAGYYSYKWAEVLDADTFEMFLEKGLYDGDTAKRYRREILERGGSEHPRVLYHRFRGRDADPGALLRREGLARQAS